MDCRQQIEFSDLLERMNLHMARNPKLRKTERRATILKVLFESGRHMTPDEIYREMCEKHDSTIGISTVYRTLTFFEEADLVNVISLGHETKRYEIKCDEHHDHLVCVECGAIEEFSDDAIELLQEAVAKKKNYKLVDHDMTLYGYCEKCQSKRGEWRT